MDTLFAANKAGGWDALADLLGVRPITMYQPSWKPTLPAKHLRYLKAARPDWFAEWEKEDHETDFDKWRSARLA